MSVYTIHADDVSIFSSLLLLDCRGLDNICKNFDITAKNAEAALRSPCAENLKTLTQLFEHAGYTFHESVNNVNMTEFYINIGVCMGWVFKDDADYETFEHLLYDELYLDDEEGWIYDDDTDYGKLIIIASSYHFRLIILHRSWDHYQASVETFSDACNEWLKPHQLKLNSLSNDVRQMVRDHIVIGSGLSEVICTILWDLFDGRIRQHPYHSIAYLSEWLSGLLDLSERLIVMLTPEDRYKPKTFEADEGKSLKAYFNKILKGKEKYRLFVIRNVGWRGPNNSASEFFHNMPFRKIDFLYCALGLDPSLRDVDAITQLVQEGNIPTSSDAHFVKEDCGKLLLELHANYLELLEKLDE